MNDRSKSLVKNTTILGFGTLCTKGIMFFMAPLFTRWLSTDEYGTFDLIVTYITLLMPILTLASGEAVFRFLLQSNNDKDKSVILSTVLVIDLVGIILACITTFILTIVFDINMIIAVSFLMYLITEVFYNYLMMAMRGEKKIDIYTISNILFVIAMAIAVYVFVYLFKLGVAGILFGYSVGDFISILLICLASKINKKIDISNYSSKKGKEMVKYSFPMIPNSISWWIVNVSDRTLISVVYGASLNAVYAIANKVPALCTTFFSVFHLSWQQNATESLSDEDRDYYYCAVFNNMISIVTSICILILGFNYWFFRLFPVDYYAGYYQSPILVISIIFSMMGQFIGGIYVAQMKSKKNGITTVVAACVNILVNLLLIKFIGLYAASISTLVAYLTLFIIRFYDIKKSIKLKLYKKNMVVFIILFYFFVISYVDVYLFKILNSIIGMCCFIIINREFVKKFLKKD